MHVVICGGGVLGAACGYELGKRDIAVTIVERWRVAGCASGKSGGFLARNWCRGTPVDALARRSFHLHEAWAQELGNAYGYRKVATFAAALSLRRKLVAAGARSLPLWLSETASHRSQIGSRETTAQLDPEAFTKALVDAAVGRGGKLVVGAIAGLEKSSDASRVTGVMLEDGRKITGDVVIIAMGPWSILAARWLPMPAIRGLKGHSVIFRPEQPLPAEAVFAEVEDGDGEFLTPEIVPRVDGTLYICGNPGRSAMPVDPAHVRPEPGACEKLRDIAIRLVPALRHAEVIAEQACYRPMAEDGLPVIGPVAGLDGAYLATGHGVWGMLNAPATAEALVDVITGGKPSHVDLAPFLPSRLEVLDPAMLPAMLQVRPS